MGDNATTTPSPRRWATPEVWPSVAVLAAYAVARVAALMWGIVRDGPPSSLLACSQVVSDGGAALQAVVVAVVLGRPGLRRTRSAWSVGAVGIAAALFGATVWVLRGDGDALRQVRQILLAVVFAVATAAVCGWRPGWAARRAGEFDLGRLRRLLWTVAGLAGMVGAVAGLVILTARPAGAAHRIADLLAQLGLLGGFVAVLCVMVVVGEQRRQATEAARSRMYRRLGEGRSPDGND